MIDFQRDAWLAGFVDGEGCFTVDERGIPRLTIKLRADDLAVLEGLRASFGGGLTVHDAAGARRPVASWHVVSKRDLTALLRYFDRHPLRAKKARDYAIWRQAVILYCSHGRNHPEVLVLRAALMAGRDYDGPLTEPLRLVREG